MYTEEVIYCSQCGGANKKSAINCQCCNKKIVSRYLPVYDFLKKHIKDDLQGKITDSVFSLVKNYLLSHVYGIMLTVSIVFTGSVVAAEAVQTKHIKEVNEIPTSHVITVDGDINTLFSSDDMDNIKHIVTNYDGFVEENITDPNYAPFYEAGHYYDSVTELYASAIPGFPYDGVHEMISNPIAAGVATEQAAMWDEEGMFRHINSSRTFDNDSLKTGDAITSRLGKQIVSEGYRVAEINYVIKIESGKNEADTLREKYVYALVLVEHEGTWYIAEDRLIENTVLV